MKAPDQGHRLIVEHKDKIKKCDISNPTISLDRGISLIQRSMIVVDPPTITQLKLQTLGDKLNHA
jgi:hypothetical protein